MQLQSNDLMLALTSLVSSIISLLTSWLTPPPVWGWFEVGCLVEDALRRRRCGVDAETEGDGGHWVIRGPGRTCNGIKANNESAKFRQDGNFSLELWLQVGVKESWKVVYDMDTIIGRDHPLDREKVHSTWKCTDCILHCHFWPDSASAPQIPSRFLKIPSRFLKIPQDSPRFFKALRVGQFRLVQTLLDLSFGHCWRLLTSSGRLVGHLLLGSCRIVDSAEWLSGGSVSCWWIEQKETEKVAWTISTGPDVAWPFVWTLLKALDQCGSIGWSSATGILQDCWLYWLKKWRIGQLLMAGTERDRESWWFVEVLEVSLRWVGCCWRPTGVALPWKV